MITPILSPLESKHFTVAELSCNCGCGLFIEQPDFLNRLFLLRKDYGGAMRITCSTRCEKHNKAVGGADNSEHLTGYAADVFIFGSMERYRFLQHALKFFNRVGIYNNFIHIGCSPEHIQNVVWTA